MKKLLLAPLYLLKILFGQFSWSPPKWLVACVGFFKRHLKIAAALILAVIVAIGLTQYIKSLPRPISTKAEISQLRVSSPDERSSSQISSLTVDFVYDLDALHADQVRPNGQPSAARIDLVEKKIESGIKLDPAKAGTWKWSSDNRLTFTPETPWPAGTQYNLSFDKTIFSDDTLLSENNYTFSSPELSARFTSTEFYQDPTDATIRRVIATVEFSHPVEEQSVEKNLSLHMLPKKALTSIGKKFDFSISYSKNKRYAYIQSTPVSLPKEPNYMTLTLKKGVSSILGGQALNSPSEGKQFIPDIYSFLKVSDANANIIRNKKNEPEQVLTLEFTDPIEKDELLSKLKVYRLPNDDEPHGRSYWNSPRKVTESSSVLDYSKATQLTMIPNPRSASSIYNFIIDEPEDSYLYLKIESGLKSVNKFVHNSFYDTVLNTPDYPKEVSISGDGSILSASGDQTLSILTRGIKSLRYTAGRLIHSDIHHLISQTRGDISNPRFKNWEFDEKNIAEFGYAYDDLDSKHPKKANYSSLELKESLPENSNEFGLFFVKVEAWNKSRNSPKYGIEDKRLVLITDLGLIVKDNHDNSHHVFVQSIANGEPVAGASVELLGANGKPIMSQTSDADGQAFFEKTSGFSDQNEPTVYIVKTDNDVSFIPFERAQRRTNLSRFDIGGDRSSSSEDSLNGFMFSDRGIYRPGESAHLGIIVKNADLSNVEDIPLEIVLYDPRGNEIENHRFTLDDLGFSEYTFETEPTSDTGNYTANLHIVRKNSRNSRYRSDQIGSTSFDVEEFQPDTLRIKNQLENTTAIGWNNTATIESTTTLTNLFGTPAQDRKITAYMSVQPQRFKFKEYESYVFSETGTDTSESSLRINKQLENKTTDADGIAKYQLDLSQFKSGTYRLRLDIEGFEQGGGRSVKALNSVLVSPLKKMIGYKANGSLDYIKADAKRDVRFIAIDNKLKQQSLNELQIKRIQIDTISTLVKQPNGTHQYQSVKKERVLSSKDFKISEAGLDLTLDSSEPGNFALEVFDENDERLSRLEYSVAGFANLASKIDKNTELEVKLEKQDYAVGETINLSIKAPYTGAGLITIEQSKVHAYKWFKTDQQSSIQSIELPDGIEGTGYINVSFVRDASSPEIFTSPLSYAVQPFSIDKSKRRVDINLKAKKIVRPGKLMAIDFSTSKPSRIAVFAINEGILQVAGYSTPEPLSHYLRKKALEVETQQILDLILPDFDIQKKLSASGGGADLRKALGANLNPFARKLDRPAVYWSGIYDADENSQTVEFDVPNTFAGELRVMAVAVSENAFGSTSTSSIVRGPFVLSPNVLTAVAPGDEFDVTIGVANIIEGSGKQADIELTVEASEHLEILGETSQALKIDEGGEDKYTFRVKAKAYLGSAELNFTASHKNESLTRSASLSVRPAMPYYADFTSGFSANKNLNIDIDRQLYPNLAEQTISVSVSPLVVVDGLTSYLEHYPHGCTEQVVSKVFPLVGLLSHPAYAPHIPEVNEQFSVLISKLRSRQNSDGGFRFWPYGNTSSVYPSIYAMHFLIESNDYGYSVPSSVLSRGKSYLKTIAQRTNINGSLLEHRNRANAIYLLSRMGEVTTNYLIDLEDNLKKVKSKVWKKDITSSYMAATYKLLKKDGEANRLISAYKLNYDKHQGLNDFHNALTLDAQHIYLLSKHFESKARDLDEKMILGLTEKIHRGEYNTISSAYAILALGAYSKAQLDKYGEAEVEFSALSNGSSEKSILDAMLSPFANADYSVETNELKIDSDKPFFYTNVQSGFNSTLPSEPVKNGLEIFREFVDQDNNVVTEFEQGKEITVRLKIRSLKDDYLSNIAVVDLLPGGFEVIRSSVARTAYNWSADYIDVREDRVVYYGRFGRQITELSYKVKLTSSGDFVIPPSFAESMYDRSIRAVSKPGKFKVTPSK